jgi:hypothetical protein
MEIAKLVLDYVKTLVWPTVVVAIGLVFRAELKALIARIRHADLPGGIGIDFPHEIAEARKLSVKVEAAPAPVEHRRGPSIPLTEANARMIQLGLRPSPSGLDMGYYRELALQDPTLALAGLRIEIDVLSKNLAKGFNVPIQERDSPTRLLRKLFDASAITDEQMQLGTKVLQLCNAAVHGSAVSREEAEAVIDIAVVLSNQFLAWLSWGFEDGWKPVASRVKSEVGK